MKVHVFNHWFKYKVPIDNHWDILKNEFIKDRGYLDPWAWLNEKYDVGQYYHWGECRNYLCFHDKNHYLTFLLKL